MHLGILLRDRNKISIFYKNYIFNNQLSLKNKILFKTRINV